MLDMEEFDFAFSFAGEDRKIVEKIHKKLKAKGFRVFYDNAYQAQLIGSDLYTGLRNLYRDKGRYVVCFISKDYSKKVWTNLEFTAIKERLMSTFFASDFLIPILIGDSKMLEDIPSFFGFYRHKTIDATIDMLVQKINTCIAADVLLSNVDSCISYICQQVVSKLNQKGLTVFLSTPTSLSFQGERQSFTLRFSADPTAQLPCIMIYREPGTPMPPFPEFIITWNRQESIYFSINRFDGSAPESNKRQTFRNIVDYICHYAENGMGR